MRVSGSGALWTMSYSYDGVVWVSAVSFTQAITPNAVSVFGGSDVDHTARVDYFFNTASPINPEDGGVRLIRWSSMR